MAKGNPINVTGEVYGLLTALRRVGVNNRGSSLWELRCQCGNFIVRSLELLRRGVVRSCGCLRSATCAARNRKHGEAVRGQASKEYRTWVVMKRRCSDTNFAGYSEYGGRGVTVCERWLVFDNFLADMGRAPSEEHTLDRLNPLGGYSPENCRWATRLEQGSGRRDNRLLTIDGQTMTVSEWSRKVGISAHVICGRLRLGWPVDRAVTTPVRKLTFKQRANPTGRERSRSKEYAAWNNAIHRCHNPKHRQYPGWGGKGIVVCNRWQDSFDNFLEDMGAAPSPEHSLERVNNKGPYSPENCCWVPRANQAANKGNNHFLTFDNETLHLAEWSRRTGIHFATLRARIRYGWTVERVLTQPLRGVE